MTVTKPRAITIDTRWRGRQFGVGIPTTRGRALTNISYMRPGGLQQAADLAAEVLWQLMVAGFDVAGKMHHDQPAKRGWWVNAHIAGAALDYDVNTFAAWLLTQENPALALDIMVIGNHWNVLSTPDCSENHQHSVRLLPEGTVACVPVFLTAAKVRKMSRGGAFTALEDTPPTSKTGQSC